MQLPFKFIPLVFLFFSDLTTAGGNFCETTQSGPWEDPNTWISCSGSIPAADSFVTINSTHVVTLNGDTDTLNSFTMLADSELIVANVPGGITFTTEFSDFDSQLGPSHYKAI